MEKSAQQWIEELGLAPIEEGGYCVRNYTAAQTIGQGADERPIGSCITYLLRGSERSNFHVIESDEIWFYHGGAPFELFGLWPDGTLRRTVLGLEADKGQVLQMIYPAGVIFGGQVLGEYGLAGCFVSPAFEQERFRLPSRKELLERFPQHREVIERFTEK